MKHIFSSYYLLGGALWLVTSGTPPTTSNFTESAPVVDGIQSAATELAHPGTGYTIGDKAEDFKLKNVDGKLVSLASYPAAKGFVVVFTCNGCPYAQMYEQRIIDLHNKLNPKGFPLIAINPNDPAVVPADSYAEMQKLAKEKSYPFAYLFDEGQKVYPKFGATRTPHVFVLDGERTVRYIGAIDDNAENADAVQKKYVEMAVEALLAGKKPEPDFTRAVGCGIKKMK